MQTFSRKANWKIFTHWCSEINAKTRNSRFCQHLCVFCRHFFRIPYGRCLVLDVTSKRSKLLPATISFISFVRIGNAASDISFIVIIKKKKKNSHYWFSHSRQLAYAWYKRNGIWYASARRGCAFLALLIACVARRREWIEWNFGDDWNWSINFTLFECWIEKMAETHYRIDKVVRYPSMRSHCCIRFFMQQFLISMKNRHKFESTVKTCGGKWKFQFHCDVRLAAPLRTLHWLCITSSACVCWPTMNQMDSLA